MNKVKNGTVLIPPGMTIQDELEFLGMQKSEFSTKMELSENDTTDLLNGQFAITKEISEKLETILGISASFWDNLEREFKANLLKIN